MRTFLNVFSGTYLRFVDEARGTLPSIVWLVRGLCVSGGVSGPRVLLTVVGSVIGGQVEEVVFEEMAGELNL